MFQIESLSMLFQFEAMIKLKIEKRDKLKFTSLKNDERNNVFDGWKKSRTPLLTLSGLVPSLKLPSFDFAVSENKELGTTTE